MHADGRPRRDRAARRRRGAGARGRAGARRHRDRAIRHRSIPLARAALQRAGERSGGFDVVAPPSSRSLTPALRRAGGRPHLDEFYVFHASPRRRAHVLARRAARDDEPLVWSRREARGRVFYSALGHTERAWRNPHHLRLVEDGLRWATS